MQRVALGKSKIKVSPVIMGMWQAAKDYWVGVEDRDIIKSVDVALEHGINAFDTAEEYGEGHSEHLLGKALKGKREKAVILSKVRWDHLDYKGVISSCEQSLSRLETNCIDLYQIHWPSGTWGSQKVSIGETMSALMQLKKQGKIHSIGVSNFSLEELKETCRYGPIDTLQSPYSLFFRHLEKELIPFCRDNGITVLSYSPLAQGFLTGKFKADHKFLEGDNRLKNKLYAEDIFPQVVEVVENLKSIAQSKKITLSQLAIAWILSHEEIAAITGVHCKEQIIENAKAMDVALRPDEIQEIEAITFPIAKKFLNDPVPWFWQP